MTTAGLYVHIPFCHAKCTYCDFCSFVGRQTTHAPYVQAVLQEALMRKEAWPGSDFDTLYVGGGTPTCLKPNLITTLISGLVDTLEMSPKEVTVEANPGTLGHDMVAALQQTGVNRLSLGVQSMNDDELAMMGRIHNARQAREAVFCARKAGIENISLDLIYGLPLQTIASWQRTLEATLALQPNHLSLYALTLDEHVPMARSISSAQLPAIDEALAADMYEMAQEYLSAADYIQYEISNWALASPADREGTIPALASRHNLHYWHNEPYLGLGTAAYSYDSRCRWGNTTDLDAYIERATDGQPCVSTSEQLSPDQHMDETMILGLRLVKGVSSQAFSQRFDVDMDSVYQKAICESVDEGLLTRDTRGIRLTRRGLLLGNRVFARFLRD